MSTAKPAQAALQQLAKFHPVVIEGAATRDTRDPVPVAAQVVRRLRAHWGGARAPPAPAAPPILVTQGDPRAPRGIAAVTRLVARELGMPRALVCLDDSVDGGEHSRSADREGVLLEVRLGALAADGEGALPPARRAAVREALLGALARKNEARRREAAEGGGGVVGAALPSWFLDYALLQELAKGALRARCGGHITIAHTQPVADISPFSVTSFFEVGLSLGLYEAAQVVAFDDLE